jgi:hypothetical protein
LYKNFRRCVIILINGGKSDLFLVQHDGFYPLPARWNKGIKMHDLKRRPERKGDGNGLQIAPVYCPANERYS